MMQHPDEGTLHAFIDGELPGREAAELERHVTMCAQCASALAEARGFAAGASRIVSALDSAPAFASRASPVTAPIARDGVRARATGRSLFRAPYLRVAAVLVLAAGSAIVLDRALPGGDTSASDMAREVGASVESMDETAAVGARLIPPAPGAEPGVASDRKGAASLVAPQPSPANLAGLVTDASATSPQRVTRYRLESGVVLTLAEEPLDTVALRQGGFQLRRPATSARATMAPSSAGGETRGNSYRWTNAEQRRTYVLTGPVTEEVLRAAASRLEELEKLP